MYRIVSFLSLIVIVVVDCQNTFMTKKDNKFICITNGNTALSWIVNKSQLLVPNLELDNESHYIPKCPKNTFDCKISNDDKTRTHFLKKPWTLENSSSSYISDGIILDRRWEQMRRYLIMPKPFLNYYVVRKTEKPDIFLALSIRADYEAHILFCDTEFPPQANICYWLTLGGPSGTKSTISECLQGSIGFKDHFYLKEKCKIIDTVEHPLLLTGNSWSHFDLLKRVSFLSMRSSAMNKRIFKRLYSSSFGLLDYVIIHSTHVNTFWKVHDVDYIFTIDTSKDVQLGPSILVQNDFVCISMFVKMCDSCNIKLKLVSGNLFFGEETFGQERSNSFSRWSEIRFLVDNIRVDKVNLLVSTINDGESYEMFWAIDDVRLCQKKEFRVISSSAEVSCQSLSYTNQLTSVNESVQLILKDCPRDNNFCVPCEWIYDYCEPLYFYISGFVLLFAILAAVVVYIYWRYQKKKKSMQIAHTTVETPEVNQNIANTHSSIQVLAKNNRAQKNLYT